MWLLVVLGVAGLGYYFLFYAPSKSIRRFMAKYELMAPVDGAVTKACDKQVDELKVLNDKED